MIVGLAALLAVVSGLASIEVLAESRDADVLWDRIDRTIQVSVGRDHLWGQVRSRLEPSDLGVSSWAAWDRDGDGLLQAGERAALAEPLRRALTRWVSISVDGTVLGLSRSKVEWIAGPEEDAPAVDAPISLRLQARSPVSLEADEHVFALYDRPGGDRVVPIRFSLVSGLELGAAQGARAERKSSRHLEAVVSRNTPAVWGSFRRVGPPSDRAAGERP